MSSDYPGKRTVVHVGPGWRGWGLFTLLDEVALPVFSEDQLGVRV